MRHKAPLKLPQPGPGKAGEGDAAAPAPGLPAGHRLPAAGVKLRLIYSLPGAE